MMVGLWSPEPPPDSDDVDVSFPVHVTVGPVSDDESDDAYEGYQPLSDFEEVVSDASSDSEREVGINELSPELDVLERNKGIGELGRTGADKEKSSSVGEGQRTGDEPGTSAGSSLGLNDPLPTDLGVSRLEMGEQQVADVIAAMANVTLPSSSFPPWANIISEDEWKREILDRIKQIENKAPSQK